MTVKIQNLLTNSRTTKIDIWSWRKVENIKYANIVATDKVIKYKKRMENTDSRNKHKEIKYMVLVQDKAHGKWKQKYKK